MRPAIAVPRKLHSVELLAEESTSLTEKTDVIIFCDRQFCKQNLSVFVSIPGSIPV